MAYQHIEIKPNTQGRGDFLVYNKEGEAIAALSFCTNPDVAATFRVSLDPMLSINTFGQASEISHFIDRLLRAYSALMEHPEMLELASDDTQTAYESRQKIIQRLAHICDDNRCSHV